MLRILFYCIIILFLIGCKKTDLNADCTENAKFERKITDQKATIRIISGHLHLTEEGTIDTKLIPCNLDDSFKTDGLVVKVTGDIYLQKHGKIYVCCTENLIIKHISKF